MKPYAILDIMCWRLWLRWDDYFLLYALFTKGHMKVFDDAMWLAIVEVTHGCPWTAHDLH